MAATAIGALLVDDEPDVRLLLRKMIEAENDGLFVAGEAAGGHEALDAIDLLNPTVIVIDERMPAMSGMETAAIIMARRPGQPIVLCTAHLDDELRERASAVGIASCVPKRDMATIPLLLKDLVAPA
jgi:two-component system nitrate/nitrite response regulator NarL